MKRFCTWGMAAFLCAAAGMADTLYFKSGGIYSCEVLGFSNGTFTVIVDGERQSAPAAHIDHIDFSTEAPGYDAAPGLFDSPYPPQPQSRAGGLLTPASYLKDKTFGDAAASLTPKELRGRLFTFENSPVKLVFKRRSAIDQIGTNEYTAILYDDDYEATTIFFDETALKYIQAVRVRYKYNEAQKKFALYGIPLSPKTMEGFELKYRRRTPVLLPIGRTLTRSLGKETSDYSW